MRSPDDQVPEVSDQAKAAEVVRRDFQPVSTDGVSLLSYFLWYSPRHSPETFPMEPKHEDANRAVLGGLACSYSGSALRDWHRNAGCSSMRDFPLWLRALHTDLCNLSCESRQHRRGSHDNSQLQRVLLGPAARISRSDVLCTHSARAWFLRSSVRADRIRTTR